MTKVRSYRQCVCADGGHEGSEQSMNLLKVALKETHKRYESYLNGKKWIEKFINELNIPDVKKITIKMHITYFIHGSESYKDFEQLMVQLGVGYLLDDKWWKEQMKGFENEQ